MKMLNKNVEIKQVEFSQHKNQLVTPCPSAECIAFQTQVQRPTVAVATNQ